MIGRTVSHFRILEKLGAGGMGVVYRAEDLTLGRTVALKFLPVDRTSDGTTKKRFVQEARLVSALQHPNVCAIHEIGETDDGQMFICMDYYEGETLKQRLQRGPLSAQEAIDVTLQVARGLQQAHKRGIIHRDIKPANIIIDSEGGVKILDFGLSKLVGETKLTKSGITVGTPAYMSPEQVRGEELDARSDVFSLGVTFYELLTGKTPFAAEHDLAVMHKIQFVAPAPLSSSGVNRAAELEPVIGKMLAKDPRDRYATVSSFMSEVAVASPIKPPTNRKRIGWLAGAGLAIAIVATLLIARYWPHPGINDADAAIAVMDFSDASDPNDKLFSSGLARLISTGLIERSAIRVVSPELIYDVRRRTFGSVDEAIRPDQALTIARKADASLMVAGERVANTPESIVIWRVVEVSSGRAINSAQVSGASVMAVADLIVAGIGTALQQRASSDAHSLGDITTNSPEAYRYYIEGVLAVQAGRAPEHVRGLLRKALAIDSTFALAAVDLSRSYAEFGAIRETQKYSDMAWRHRDRLGVKDALRLQALRQRLANKATAGRATYRELVARWPDDATILREFCAQLFYGLHFKEAADLAPRLMSLYPNDAALASTVGISLLYTGRDDEALAAFRRAVRLHPEGGDYWDSLGRAYNTRAMFDSSALAFTRALETIPPYPLAYEGIAQTAYCKGDIQGAIRSLESALPKLSEDARETLLGNPNQWFSLSVLLAEAGQFRRSVALFDEVADIEDPRGLQTPWHLVAALWRAGQWKRVVEYTRKWERPGESLAGYQAAAYVELDSLTLAQRAADQFAESWISTSGAGNGMQFVDHVRAYIALASGDADQALTLLAGIREQGFARPSPWEIEVRDLVAHAQKNGGKLSDAARTHEGTLRIYQGHALGHYELAKIYEELGNAAGARQELETFLRLWENADPGLPQTADAHARLSRLKATN